MVRKLEHVNTCLANFFYKSTRHLVVVFIIIEVKGSNLLNYSSTTIFPKDVREHCSLLGAGATQDIFVVLKVLKTV